MLRHFLLNASDAQISQMKQRFKAAQVAMGAHGVNGFSRDHGKNRQVLEFAKKAGLRNITANPLPEACDSFDK